MLCSAACDNAVFVNGRGRVGSVTVQIDGVTDHTNSYKYTHSGDVRQILQTGPNVTGGELKVYGTILGR